MHSAHLVMRDGWILTGTRSNLVAGGPGGCNTFVEGIGYCINVLKG